MSSSGAATHWLDNPPPVERLRFRRIPLLLAALCFAAGDLLARQPHGPLLLAASTATLFALALPAFQQAPRVAALAVLACWIAIGCWCAQLEPAIPTQSDFTQQFADTLSRTVHGRIVRIRQLNASPIDDDPQAQLLPWQLEPGATETSTTRATQSIDIAVESAEYLTPDISMQQPTSAGVRVTLQGPAIPLACGDLIELPLSLHTPEIYRDPGAWSYRDQLLSEGISALATAKSSVVQTLAHGGGTWHCRLFAAQTWAAARLQTFVDSRANHSLPSFARLHDTDAAMLNAMLFGDRSQLSPSLRTGFERTGTFHLFVVSGLHVVLLAGAIFWTLRRLRLPEAPAVFLTLAAATSYALLTGFGLPVQRALAMTSIYLLARWLNRDANALNALGVAALFVLALDPRALLEAGFQMTFLVILAIAGLASPINQRLTQPRLYALLNLSILNIDHALPPHLAQFRIRVRMACDLSAVFLGPRLRNLPAWILRAIYHLLEVFLLGLAAELVMVLPMAIYFHRAALLALPLNIVDIPLVAALLSLALLTFLAALLSTWLATIPAAATALVLHAMRFTVDHAQHNPLSDIRLPAPSPTAVLLACTLLAFACIALRARHKLWLRCGVAAALLIPFAVLWPSPPLVHRNQLEVTAIDVGQGDSLLVVSPTGHTLLVDAGGPTGVASLNLLAGNQRWDVGEEVVAPYLWSRRFRRLDAVLLTHAHSDHMGGMPAILRDFRPRELWLSLEPAHSAGLRALLAQAAAQHILVRRFRAGDAFPWAGLDATILAPEASYANPGDATNNDSLVMRLAYQQASVLLEGDAEAPSEYAMLANNRVQPATLLKVGHHGSITSTNAAFLAAVAPQDAVISVGARNTFGHPRGEVLARLEAAHTHTYRTDRHGAETFLLSADGRISTSAAASN